MKVQDKKALRNFLRYTPACMLCRFSLVALFVTLNCIVHQVPLSRGFSREEYQSGLPCPPPGDPLDQEIELVSPTLTGRFLFCFVFFFSLFLFGRKFLYDILLGSVIRQHESAIGIHMSPPSFFKIYFSWRLITLQYCGGFCHAFT